ncbi:transcriptional activator of proteases prtT [Fusarium tjaetaba]|uniref:Transcriptional activator of proteases prtT n=1 Tax=Fusarium tjaetaba TaxID=1567544 RepID=A0A8H5S0W9_9HYPO|nr:transcriptional activator of proteases prtT [Fusarium tjaetaba]KAF5642067.1 transcriptional activator of proteases prtT [Fusarium tjaetaba]
MKKNSALIYIRAPNLDYEPNKAIRLGHIWKHPMDPGSFCGPPLPIPEDMETNYTFKAPWYIGKGRANSGSLGIWASFLQAVGVTAESNFDWNNAKDVSHTCERLDTYSIEPTDDYVKESVKAVASEAVRRRERLFMVTGVKIARGAVGSISSSRRVGGGARVGFGGESLGVPFDGGPQFNISRDIYDEETYGESSDFVFAYRVRRIIYPKGGWESTHAGSSIVNYGLHEVDAGVSVSIGSRASPFNSRFEFFEGDEAEIPGPLLVGYPSTWQEPTSLLTLDSLHQKVLHLESSMQDIRAQLVKLQSGRDSAHQSVIEQSASPQASTNSRVLMDEIEPADQHVHAAPAEVIRRVACQVTGDLRRAFHTKEDVVRMGMLNATTAETLVKSFIRRRRHVLFINDESDLVTRGSLIQTSPFLHAVLCSHEMRFTHTSQTDALKHRQVYEHMRNMLGQVVLGSPLHLEEITGVLICSLFAGSPSCEAEYVDSWLLSGICSQQAMLCIQFSDIHQRTNAGTSTKLDLRSMRIWANICLNHLQNLLNFEQTTMRDAMLLAEISLYCTLQKEDCVKPTFANDGFSSKFAIWKQQYGYLLDLPTGLMLKFSYCIANVILAKRTLDRVEADALNLASSLSPQTSRSSTVNLQDPSTKSLQGHVYELSFRVIQAFIAIPSSSSGDLPEFHSLCVAYALLILGQYDELPPAVAKNELYSALQEMRRRCSESNAYSVAVRLSVERAWDNFLRVDGVNSVEVVRQESQFHSHAAQSTNANKACHNTGAGGQVESLDLDFFFNGGYLDLLDVDNFLV